VVHMRLPRNYCLYLQGKAISYNDFKSVHGTDSDLQVFRLFPKFLCPVLAPTNSDESEYYKTNIQICLDENRPKL
jgi:hypothetical protein